MRSLPATGRRLLQAISTRHVRSVLSAAPHTTARLAPAKALASGAAVVAAGALLIPTGQAIAQTAHPGDRIAVTATAEGTPAEVAEYHLPEATALQSEQAKTAKAVLAASLEQAGLTQAPAEDQHQEQHQDESASRGEDRAELPADGQQQDEQATADQAAAEQHAADEKAATEKAAAEQAAAAAAAAQAKPAWSSPAPGATISNPYHKTNAAYAAGYHTGTDFAVSVGTPVLAVGDATVVSSGYAGAYGNQVVLKLSDGRFAQYAHLSQLGVKAGQHVDAGQQVGKSGNTGNSHGPHLHFEIRTANQYAKVIDPVGYLKQHGATNF
ncbi:MULTISPECIES: M23 family metallopeptidase [Kitasatospora]|uniref:Putative peptidase M23 family protein n=1 Tax=Kitasatospora setae (strain ATCC 33774 / DSM 43861 / JCM 3304 / KCC A-0304 / NBRC 14216 / KM-6054) TaxID=452652 RepID=E4NDE2_KITSK|nr:MULTISPECIES: M23 family metallopeptidase [Kitasatospora]BAJ29223.1 putative peptidase M23 family protein [Kitasatospora setae KM-6054]